MALTRGIGPLAPHPPATVNYSVDGPAHRLFAHPFPRRVRGTFAGRTVVDTRDGLLLHETALLPVLYVPFVDVDPAVLVPSGHTTHCPFKGDARYHDLAVDGRRVPNAVWSYPEPLPAAAWLGGRAAFYWDALDAWYDEDEQVHAHLTDPFTRIDVRPVRAAVEVRFGDLLLARADHAMVLSETGLPNRWYLDRADVRVLLTPSTTETRCPYKGAARYWTAVLPAGSGPTDATTPHATTRDTSSLPDVAWEYPDPFPEAARIAGLLSFAGDGVTVHVEGRPA